MRNRFIVGALGALIATGSALVTSADEDNGQTYQRVLLISIDGMHAVDFRTVSATVRARTSRARHKLTREALLMKLGAAQSKAPAAWRLITVEMAVQGASFGYWLNRKKLRECVGVKAAIYCVPT